MPEQSSGPSQGTTGRGPRVRTLTGDIPADALGVTDAHDHLFLSSAALSGKELDDEAAALAEARAFREQGGGTLVQWSPAGTGRRLDALRRVAEQTGLHMVAATGRHRREHYPPESAVASMGLEKLTELFLADITQRQCGLVKVGTGYWSLDDHERVHLDAAAAAAVATGVPVAVHLERGTNAVAVLDRLTAAGLPADRVVLGHLGRFPDAASIAEVLDAGASACFDGPSLANHATDWRTPRLLADLIERSHLDRLLLGADTTNTTAQPARGGAPGTSGFLRWTSEVVRPSVGEGALQQMLVANPARILALAS